MKKIILIFLSVLLSLCAFCACGGETETDTSGGEGEIPRLDYFAVDPFDYVNIDREAYKNLSLTLEEDFAVSDEAVDRYIQKMLYDSKKKSGDGGRVTSVPLKRGDAAFIFYKGEVDGKEFEGGSNMNDDAPYELHLGSNAFIEGFEEGLIGIIPKETSPENMHTLNLKFPENTTNKALAGKDVVFHVYVVYAVQYDIPKYDEETILETFKFITDEDDVIAAYEKYVREYLEAEGEKNRNLLAENELWDILLDATRVLQYPQEELDFYFSSYKSQIEYYYRLSTYNGNKYDSFDAFAREYMGLEKGADWEEALRSVCKEMVTQNLIYHAIAKLEGIEVTEDEYKNEVDYYAKQYNCSKEQVIAEMGETYIKESALYKKVVQGFLLPSCNIVYDK